MGLDFRNAIWLAPLAFGIHEMEEWNIDSFEKTHFADPGYASLVDHPVLWIGLALITLAGILWTALTSWPKNARFAAFLTLPFFIFVAFGNALQHLVWTVSFRTYAPGVVTAVLLVAPVVIGLTILALRQRLIPWWYAVVLYVALTPTLISTVRGAASVPPELPPNVQNAQRNGIRIARAILGRDRSATQGQSVVGDRK